MAEKAGRKKEEETWRATTGTKVSWDGWEGVGEGQKERAEKAWTRANA